MATKKKSSVKRYVITSAQASYQEKYNTRTEEYDYIQRGDVAALNQPLMKNIEHYCKDHGAELVILTMNGKDASEKIFHETIEDRPELFHGTRKLNNNVQISDMVVPPQNVDPSTGRLRFAQRDTTLVYAHPKQRLRAVPASNSKLPKLLVTTGAVTHPNYNTENHRGDVAFRDHTYGAVVVEVIDSEHYNIRHIRARRNGTLVDMGQRYAGKKPTKAKTEALVLGDLHIGDQEEKTMLANYEMIDFFQPQRLILHDLFNGHSINHHEQTNVVKSIRDFESGRLDLEEELQQDYEELVGLAQMMGKKDVYIVSSNHHAFLPRYINEQDWKKSDKWNARIAAQLFEDGIGLEIPEEQIDDASFLLEAGLKRFGKIPLNVHFLKLNDDLKVWGYQLASHGHKGNAGSRRGTAKSREIAHGQSITAHTHSPEVFRDTFIVGTSTKLDLPYTHGSASAWLPANAVLYEGGIVQLLPIINGKWKVKE